MLLIAIGVLYWGIFISLVGMGFFMYGKKRPDGIAMITGIVLMVYPYFISSVGWSIAAGVIVLAAYLVARKIL
jgi:hypothetical protein